jgi:hypothetical protein
MKLLETYKQMIGEVTGRFFLLCAISAIGAFTYGYDRRSPSRLTTRSSPFRADWISARNQSTGGVQSWVILTLMHSSEMPPL